MNPLQRFLITPSRLLLPSGATLSIPTCFSLFELWQGPRIPDSYGGKAVLDCNGEPLFAELAILRVIQEDPGWDGVWIDTYRKRFRQFIPPHSATKASAKAYWWPADQCWIVGFTWALPQQPGGFTTKVRVEVEGSRLVSIDQWTGPGSFFGAFGELNLSYIPPWRYFLSSLIMFAFVFVLFLARKVYREPRSAQNLRLAVLMGLCGAVTLPPALPELLGPVEQWLYRLVWAAMTFCILTLLSYALLNTVLYYLRRCFPVQAANYLQLFREHVFARTAGLEMLRGAFAGAAFGGVWMVLVSLGAIGRKAAVGMVWWLDLIGNGPDGLL